MKIELAEGLCFNMDEKALNDWRLIELLDELDTNPIVMVKIAKMLLDPESYKKLKTLNTDKEGHINAEKVQEMLTEIMLAGQTSKK